VLNSGKLDLDAGFPQVEREAGTYRRAGAVLHGVHVRQEGARAHD
jgi:hypothetical protein